MPCYYCSVNRDDKTFFAPNLLVRTFTVLRDSVAGNFSISFFFFYQNKAPIYLFIHKTILQHQENEIHQVLKEEKVMVCSCTF